MVWQKTPLLEKRLSTERALFALERECPGGGKLPLFGPWPRLEATEMPSCQVGRALSLRRRSSCLHHSLSSPILMET